MSEGYDALGDRMKDYERRETGRRFLPLLPIYARIDGRSFSRFTRGMARPYDLRLSNAMIETTKVLIGETQARIGYTRSDEISLLWLAESYEGEVFFDGKIQKMVSVLAGLATAHFDCRVCQLPNKAEAANALLWRELDATKNAVNMAARLHYGTSELHGKSGPELQEMLFRKGINFNDYPPLFKRGSFVRRRTVERSLSTEELTRIPETYRPDPEALFARSEITALDMPKFSTVTNRIEVIFDGAEPSTEAR